MTTTTDFVKSAVWYSGVSWFNRLLGLVSVFILARLLSPADFGVMASIMVVIQLAQTLSDAGCEQYYIQKQQATEQDLVLSWSVNLVLKTGMSACIMIATALLPSMGLSDTLQAPLFVLAMLPFLTALTNKEVMALKKRIQFHRFSHLLVFSQLAGNLTSIGLAVMLHSYWALVYGVLLNTLVYTALSHLLLPSKMAFTLQQWRLPFHFGKWVILRSVVGHTRAKFDIWFAASVFTPSELGGYQINKDISVMPSREILGPVQQVVFSGVASHPRHSTAQINHIYGALFLLLSIATAMTTGLSALATPLTHILLGEQWLEFAPLLHYLAIMLVTFTIGNFYSDVLTATGYVKSLFIFDCLSLGVSLALLTSFTTWLTHAADLAVFRSATGLLVIGGGLAWMVVVLNLSFLRTGRLIFTALVPAIGMYLSLQPLAGLALSPLAHVALSIVVGVFVYSLIWVIMLLLGTPDRQDKDYLTSLIKRIKSR